MPLAEIAGEHGTPVYAYGARTVRRRLGEIRAALRETGAPFRIHYAMKACRFGPVLDVIRREGDVGIDACSPREVERAIAAGFVPSEISVDGRHALEPGSVAPRPAWGPPQPGHAIGVAAVGGDPGPLPRRRPPRLDPGVRVGWGERPDLSYGGSKFGFDLDEAVDAAAYAASLGLEVDELHVHAGWGLQASAAPELSAVFARLAALARAIPTVRTLNVGGGLCGRHRAEDEPLAPATWAALIREHLAPTGCTLACEPGTFVAATAGALVAEVNTAETRRSGRWIGIDAGHNVNVYAAHYGIPLAIAKVAQLRSSRPPLSCMWRGTSTRRMTFSR